MQDCKFAAVFLFMSLRVLDLSQRFHHYENRHALLPKRFWSNSIISHFNWYLLLRRSAAKRLGCELEWERQTQINPWFFNVMSFVQVMTRVRPIKHNARSTEKTQFRLFIYSKHDSSRARKNGKVWNNFHPMTSLSRFKLDSLICENQIYREFRPICETPDAEHNSFSSTLLIFSSTFLVQHFRRNFFLAHSSKFWWCATLKTSDFGCSSLRASIRYRYRGWLLLNGRYHEHKYGVWHLRNSPSDSCVKLSPDEIFLFPFHRCWWLCHTFTFLHKVSVHRLILTTSVRTLLSRLLINCLYISFRKLISPNGFM